MVPTLTGTGVDKVTLFELGEPVISTFSALWLPELLI